MPEKGGARSVHVETGHPALRCAGSGSASGKKRQTYYVQLDLIEEIRRYAYWERCRISDVINMALEEFFKDKKLKKIPERE